MQTIRSYRTDHTVRCTGRIDLVCPMYTDLDHIDQVGHKDTDYIDHRDHTKYKSYISEIICIPRTELDHTDQVDHTYTDYTLQIITIQNIQIIRVI